MKQLFIFCCLTMTFLTINFIYPNLTSTFRRINGGYTIWSDWSPCLKTCNKSYQVRWRNCSNPVPSIYGEKCFSLGPSVDYRTCESAPCAIDGEVGHWSDWGNCEPQCKDGFMKRYRKCDSPAPQYGGFDCFKYLEERKQCLHLKVCVVDGGYSGWSKYGKCTVTCGEGIKTKRRTCNKPLPKNGGKKCVGPAKETQVCKEKACPVDGKFSEWSTYSTCSKTCDDGIVKRNRECKSPAPSGGGKDCIGEKEETKACNLQPCVTKTEQSTKAKTLEQNDVPAKEDEKDKEKKDEAGNKEEKKKEAKNEGVKKDEANKGEETKDKVKKEGVKKEGAKKNEAAKKDEAKKEGEKKEEAKKGEEKKDKVKNEAAKKDEAKKEGEKIEEAMKGGEKKNEPKNEGVKKDEAKKGEEKKDEVKKEGVKKEEARKEEKKNEPKNEGVKKDEVKNEGVKKEGEKKEETKTEGEKKEEETKDKVKSEEVKKTR